MKDGLKFWLVHTIHWAVLYCAFGLGLDGAMYTLKFWTWVTAVVSLFLLSDDAIADASKRPAWGAIRSTLSWAQAWVTLGLLVWFGHIATALACGLFMLVSACHRDKVRELRKAAAA